MSKRINARRLSARRLRLNVREMRRDYRYKVTCLEAPKPVAATERSPQPEAPSHTPHNRIIDIERPVTWVVLAGFMGAGKSRIGWELSRHLGLHFVDTDKVIERVSCLSVPDIFEHYGENVFRDYETEVVRRCLKLDFVVVSTGGGTVVRDVNRAMLKSRGPVVLLSASPETTYERTRRHKRPLLECDDPVGRIRELMAARKNAYEDAATLHVSTDGRPSSDVVEEIVHKLWLWLEGHPWEDAADEPRSQRGNG